MNLEPPQHDPLKVPDYVAPGILSLISQVPGAVVFATDAEGRYVFLDGSGLSHLGIVPEEWIGRSMFEFLEGKPEHQAMMKRIFRGETLIDNSSFGNHYFEDRFCPLYDRDGKLSGIAGIQFNVTEKVRVENALKQNIELLDNLFNSIPDNAYVLDQNFNVLRVNETVRNAFSELPVIGNPCYQTIHGRETPCVFCPVVQTYRTGQPALREYFEKKVNRYFELLSFPIRDRQSGEVIGATEFARDITERKKIEESLLRSQLLLDELMENLVEGVYLIDTDYTLVRVNKALRKMYPDMDPLLGRKCHETTVNDGVCPDCPAERMFREGKMINQTIFQKDRRGVGRWLEVTTFPLYSFDDGRVNGGICVLRDVTPRIEMESQLDDYRIRIQPGYFIGCGAGRDFWSREKFLSIIGDIILIPL